MNEQNMKIENAKLAVSNAKVAIDNAKITIDDAKSVLDGYPIESYMKSFVVLWITLIALFCLFVSALDVAVKNEQKSVDNEFLVTKDMLCGKFIVRHMCTDPTNNMEDIAVITIKENGRFYSYSNEGRSKDGDWTLENGILKLHWINDEFDAIGKLTYDKKTFSLKFEFENFNYHFEPYPGSVHYWR